MIDPFTRTRFHPDLALETWFPVGELDIAMATFMVHYIGFEEFIAERPFNRYSDLTGLSKVHLDSKELSDLVALRRASYDGGPAVKSAILAVADPAHGVATTFAALMEDCPIHVRVFRTVEEAAKWLEVPVKALISNT